MSKIPHEIFVENQCRECPVTIDHELGWCPVAFLHLYHFADLSDEAKQVLFRGGECAMRKVIESNTSPKVVPVQKTLPMA